MSQVIATFTETLGHFTPGWMQVVDQMDGTVTVMVKTGALLGLGTSGTIHMTKAELLEFFGLCGIHIAPIPASVHITAGSP